MQESHSMVEKIVDAALDLAEKSSWEEVRLFDIAQQLTNDLVDIHLHFREKDELIDAFFDRADKAMLETAKKLDTINLDSQQRLHKLLMSWFKAIENYRRVVREMIWGKLEPGRHNLAHNLQLI